jgi:hypothetical protein
MPTITIRYDEVKAQAVRKGPCPRCGRKTTRRRTFTMTISPYNRNPNGTVRTPAEVQEAVDALAAGWKPDPKLFIHSSCFRRR